MCFWTDHVVFVVCSFSSTEYTRFSNWHWCRDQDMEELQRKVASRRGQRAHLIKLNHKMEDIMAAELEAVQRATMGFDKTLTPGQLTPYWPLYWTPLLNPYEINGRMKIKNPRTINGTRFKFINKFSLPESSKMAVALQISDSLLIWLKDLSGKIEHRTSCQEFQLMGRKTGKVWPLQRVQDERCPFE